MRKLFLLFFSCSLLAAFAQQSTVTIVNPTAMQRSELVAVDTTQLGFDASKGVVVRDAFGIERTSQLTYDGKLLLDVHLRPHSQTSLLSIHNNNDEKTSIITHIFPLSSAVYDGRWP